MRTAKLVNLMKIEFKFFLNFLTLSIVFQTYLDKKININRLMLTFILI